MAQHDSEPDFDQIGRDLLARDEIAAHIIPMPGKATSEGRRLICFAHHEACLNVLVDDDTFTLRPYDDAFKTLLPHEDLKAILGENSRERSFRVHTLRQASVKLVAQLSDGTGSDPNRPQDALVDWVEDVTRHNCRTLIDILRATSKRQNSFNLVREYIWPIATMSVRDIAGFRMTDKLSLGSRVILFLRNLDSLRDSGRTWFSPRGDLAAATNMHLGMLTLAGHIVASGSGGSALLEGLARHSLKHFLAHYPKVSLQTALCQPHSFAQTFYNPDFREDILKWRDTSGHTIQAEKYEVYARNTVLELVIAMGGLMPLAITQAFQFATGPGAARAGTDWDTFAQAMTTPGLRNAAFAEALRLSPPVARVFRTASTATRINGVDVNEGDQIALLFSNAANDPKAFPNPASFRLDRESYMDFGHVLSPHNCFGEHIAKTIFGVLFEELTKVAEPSFAPPKDGLTMFAGQLPDHMPWTFISS